MMYYRIKTRFIRFGLAIATILGVLPIAAHSFGGEPVFKDVILAVHGGTGGAKTDVSPELNQALRTDLAAALRAGAEALAKPNAAALDGVETAIRILEDSPHFNAGKGAVFTHDGRNELDASIMEGKAKRAGSVAGVTVIKNPITAARAVMEQSKHVMLVGPGAEEFARLKKLDIVSPEYFRTDRRWQQLQDDLREEAEAEKHSQNHRPAHTPSHEWSTVGAVAIGPDGNLAAGTSTGGMSNKRHGRVGDSPIIGAGTYADNEACAVSCTGHGEFFIRYAVAHEIAARMKFAKATVEQAATAVVQDELRAAGGEGGVIAIDRDGHCAFAYNSEGLYRGYITRDGTVKVMLYED
jgi:beta-aspartyl-peptidase (threonine type)